MNDLGQNLVRILEDASHRGNTLVIPEFQRFYRWPAAKAIQMLQLLWDAAERVPREPLFLGSVILAAGRNNETLIVDGQQRISTFVMILAAGRRVYLDLRAKPGARESWMEKVGPYFRITYWGRNFAENEDDARNPVFLMRTKQQDQWTSLYDLEGNPFHPPEEKLDAAQVGQYLVNYQSIYHELRNRIENFNGVANQRVALERFGEFIIGSARVLLANAPNLAIAYEVFRITNIPGEPLDVATIIKHRLAVGREGMDEQELNETFSRATPGADLSKDEMVVKVVLQALFPGADVDDLVRGIIGGGEFPIPEGQNLRAIKLMFCRLLNLHADLEMLNQQVNHRPDNLNRGFYEAVQKLFQFEFACTRSNRNDEMVVTDKSDLLWRSVAIKVLNTLNVKVRLQPHAGAVALIDGGATQVERARTIFVALERRMLCYSLPIPGLLRVALTRTMTNVLKAQTFDEIVSLVTPPVDMITAAITSLDRPLYIKGNRSVSALRYILGQVNVLWHVHEDRGAGIPQAEDLRFNTDWTTEHIYAQAADGTLAPNAHLWFNDRTFSRIHCLGNLLPLHPSLQQRASNEAYCVKRETYEISSNVLSRAASRLAGFQAGPSNDEQRASFEREVTYLPLRFLQRHSRLKTLIARHIFGRDGGCAAVPGFAFYPPPDTPPDAPTDSDIRSPVSPPSQALDGSQGDFSPRLRLRGTSHPQLPIHLRTSRARVTLEAYVAALAWIPDRADRDRVKTAIDKLVVEALSAAPHDPCVRKYLEFAGETDFDKNNSKHIIYTRRVEIVSRFARGQVTLHELEGSPGPSANISVNIAGKVLGDIGSTVSQSDHDSALHIPSEAAGGSKTTGNSADSTAAITTSNGLTVIDIGEDSAAGDDLGQNALSPLQAFRAELIADVARLHDRQGEKRVADDQFDRPSPRKKVFVREEYNEEKIFRDLWQDFKTEMFSDLRLDKAIQALQAVIVISEKNGEFENVAKYKTMMNQIEEARAKKDGGHALRELKFNWKN